MDHIDTLERSYDDLAKLVANLAPADFAKPTPCSEWDVRAVLNHVLGAARMFTLVNDGQTAGPDAGDVVGDDPDGAVAAIAKDNVESWRRPNALDGDRTFPFGTFPAPAALVLNVTENVVHAWDLAKATGQDVAIDPQTASALCDFWLPIPIDPHRASGSFGPEIHADTSAPALERLLAYLGREPEQRR